MASSFIFDFDGVIVNTEQMNFENLRKILGKHNYELKDSDFKDFMGRKTVPFLREKFKSMSYELSQIVLSEKRSMQDASIEMIKPVDGLAELLEFLKASKYKLGICTVSPGSFVNKVLEFNALSVYFDVVISEEDVKVPKPDPECYRVALKKMNSQPEETIAIEDSPAGVMAAKNAGCKVFVIDNNENHKGPAQGTGEMTFRNHYAILAYVKTNQI